MISLTSIVNVKGLSGKSVYDFMLTCTDDVYQKWWPGTHLAFHTVKRFPEDIGNLVRFDEYVGRRRLKFAAIVVTAIPAKRIVWQIKKGIKLPAWIILTFEDKNQGVEITHSIVAGFNGAGKIADLLLRLYFSKNFEHQIDAHAQVEFTKLKKFLR